MTYWKRLKSRVCKSICSDPVIENTSKKRWNFDRKELANNIGLKRAQKRLEMKALWTTAVVNYDNNIRNKKINNNNNK